MEIKRENYLQQIILKKEPSRLLHSGITASAPLFFQSCRICPLSPHLFQTPVHRPHHSTRHRLIVNADKYSCETGCLLPGKTSLWNACPVLTSVRIPKGYRRQPACKTVWPPPPARLSGSGSTSVLQSPLRLSCRKPPVSADSA